MKNMFEKYQIYQQVPYALAAQTAFIPQSVTCV